MEASNTSQLLLKDVNGPGLDENRMALLRAAVVAQQQPPAGGGMNLALLQELSNLARVGNPDMGAAAVASSLLFQQTLALSALQQQQQQQQQQRTGLPTSMALSSMFLNPASGLINNGLPASGLLTQSPSAASSPSILAANANLQKLSPTLESVDAMQAVKVGLTEPLDETALGDASGKKVGRLASFPRKLHELLLDLEKFPEGKQLAAFLPHGQSFVIFRPKEFAKFILPKYFSMTSYASFQRQLNLYEFRRVSTGPDKGSYHHKLFIRNQPHLCGLMKRNKKRKKASTDDK